MADTPLTCDVVDRDDIDQRYLAGTLSPGEAEAFEEHYFDCERCWALVQRGLAVRAAGAAGAPVASTRRASRPQWWIGLAAAGVLAASMALWYSSRGRAFDGEDATRGSGAAVGALALVRGDSVFVAWRRVSDATDYRVRFSAPDGSPLFDGVVSDSSLTIPRTALAGAAPETAFVSVMARDALAHPLAQSALTPLALPRR
jgi:anti-sigma factor RsiW